MSHHAKVIFHIDINAFFASAHLILDPSLQGKPVVVARDATGSVITTASYEAREYGINSAMPLSRAKQLCKDLVIVEMDFGWYQELSEQFMEIVSTFGSSIQPMSIDECYLDVTESIKRYKRPLDLAVTIQKTVHEKLKLPVSIGVGPNKFLAKMASDMKKPMGITVLRKREVDTMLWPLPIEDMYGIGKKTVPKLKAQGIVTIGDLAHANPDSIRNILGINTENYIDRANGNASSQIEESSVAKSVGQSKTLIPAIHDFDELKTAILHEVVQVERRLKKTGMVGKTVQFSLRLENYKTASRSVTLDRYIDSKNDIFENALMLYDEFEGEGAVTFISVALSNLLPREDVVSQINLFDVTRNLKTDELIGKLNNALKTDVFKKASDVRASGKKL
ncbi:DNA polymerase IV [Erysipelothrix larvae]|uniref:DNA polymerase IV n=1 Tax=Erysipelothrix larvae TaxID=1514105 RepID=A0A0X8GZL8_9FIRM|nr:DNA polymerase IV [Erysipelothrix larvae]AMC93336.1 DNA polymerase IV [Erysipelothrix larvae]